MEYHILEARYLHDYTVWVRCRDGSTTEGGYVTGHMHTKIRMVGDKPCARSEEV